MLQKLPFQHCVSESTPEINNDVRFQLQALLAVQEASDAYLVDLFEDVKLLPIHTRRVHFMPKDIHLTCCICGEHK